MDNFDDSAWRAHRKLVDNVIYYLLYDSVAIGSGELQKLPTARRGKRNRNVIQIREQAGLRVRSRILRDLNKPQMSMFFNHFGWEPETAKGLVRDLLDGRHLEIGREIVESLKHAGRIYEHRGIGAIKARKKEAERRQAAWEDSLRRID